ncbi:hypothetical protein TcG_08876 [Trypanosoma cruzi]|nr:hypothetical protein TcG_08876 [Trypanosoma cruzi]
MSGSSLLSCVVSRVAPSLLAPRRDDPDAFLRHLQLLSKDFITRFSSPEAILTPYFSSKEQIQPAATSASENSVLNVPSSAHGAVDELCPLQIALKFLLGEKQSCNRMHVFELSIFLALLRHPCQGYKNILLWSSLIEKLEELGFYYVMQRRISQLWEAVKQQEGELDVYNELRLIRLSCDVVLFFGEHAPQIPSQDVLRELALLAQEMWADSASMVVRRCALVISVFLTKYSLISIEALCSSKTGVDSPYCLVVLASVPALRERTDANPELLRAALEVVFTTTVYSTPIATYFSGEGVHSVSLSLVQRQFAKVLYDLFSGVSGEFWGYFTGAALLSAMEAVARYACLWDFLPSGVPLLRPYIRNYLAEGSSVYAVSLFNFYASALAYHVGFDALIDEEAAILNRSTPFYITHDSLLEGEAEEKGAALTHNTEGLTMVMTDTPMKKTFRLLAMGWRSFRGGEKVVVRSAFSLLHALMSNYSSYQKVLEEVIGCKLYSLFPHVANVVLTDSVDDDDVELVETFYGTISSFYPLLGNVAYTTSNLLRPDLMKGVGVRYESTEIALLHLKIYDTLFKSYENAVPFVGIVEAVTHIPHGLIPCSFLAMEFFVHWLSFVQAVPLEVPRSLFQLLSKEESMARLIYRLCEGIFVLLRELQSGNVFLCSLPATPLLEGAICLLSAAVSDGGHHNTLATCVIATYGENTLSACFMLYCVIFSPNASVSLVESTAGLLAYVLERSQEKLFGTMRFHTSTELRRILLSSIHHELQLSTASNKSVNVFRLASLRYLLYLDPASFFFLMLPEERDSGGGSSELPLTCILRDKLGCVEITPLEKAEAFDLLRALDDLDFPITSAVNLLSDIIGGSAYVQAAFTAAAIKYICGSIIGKMHLEGSQSAKYGERGGSQQRSPSRSTIQNEKGNLSSGDVAAIRVMLETGSRALEHCSAFYQVIERQTGTVNNWVDSRLSGDAPKRNSQELVLSRVTQDVVSNLSTFTSIGLSVNSLQAGSGKIKLKPMLLGDGFLLWNDGEEDVISLNHLASALEAMTRLTASLEAVAWLTCGEKEAHFASSKLLELSLQGMQMVGHTAIPLRGLMWSCFEGWLSLACGAASVHMQSLREFALISSPLKLNVLFQDFVKLMISNHEHIDVVCQGITVLLAFQPVGSLDEGAAIKIFEFILKFLETHLNRAPLSSLTTLILGCGVIYGRMGKFSPVRCALSTLENLWTFATNLSYKIPATGPASTLSDIFDHVLGAASTVLLQNDELTTYFSHKRVIALANALGQFNDAAIYDPIANLYGPQAWHRAWLSVLLLLRAVLVKMEGNRSDCSEWLNAVSTLAATSPRFQDAVSGFVSLGDVKEAKIFAWELREMQLCTSIIALLASFGFSNASLTPHVRRCFCHIRRYQIPAVAVVDERVVKGLLVTTIRDQLSYLIQQSPPPTFSEEDLFIVTIERYRTSSTNSSYVLHEDSPQQRMVGNGSELREELLSFDVLRSFILRELNIIRRLHQDSAPGAEAYYPPEHTPLSHSSFTTATSVDSVLEVEFHEGGNQNSAPHIENVKLALGLFVRYARLYLSTRSLALLDRQELSVSLEKLLHALNRLIHDVRRLGNSVLTGIVENVREDLKSLAGILQNS